MIWLIGCKGMLGTEIARQLSENKIDFVGTDIDVVLLKFKVVAQLTNKDNTPIKAINKIFFFIKSS